MVGENMNNLYKPSNKFSPVGLPLMFLAMLAAGVAVSWLYLVIASVIPLIYLNILMAVGISMLLGFIGAKFVRIFKIRAPIIAIVITAVALIFVNYAKWAIYVGRDWNKNFYDDMKDTKVSELLTEEDLPSNQEEAEQMAESLPLFKNYTFSSLASISSDAASWISTVEKLFGDTLYDMYAGLLGTTADEILESSEKLRSSNMSLYEYMYEYRGMKERTTGFLLTHPGELFSDIKDINSVGRWTIKSHRYSSGFDADAEPVHGFMLWIVWLGELLILTIPALVMVYGEAKKPFIESEDEWAIEEKPMPEFRFKDSTGSTGVSQGMIKSDVMRDPYRLFDLEPIPVIAPIPDFFYQVTFVHSKYYDEIYITLLYSKLTNARKNQRQTSKLITDMRVDADFLATLYGRFGVTKPALCQGENRAEDVARENAEKKAAAPAPHAPQRPKSTGADAIFDEPSLYRQSQEKAAQSYAAQELEKEKKAAEEAAKQDQSASSSSFTSSGDMDGLDTSSLDLSKIDFK